MLMTRNKDVIVRILDECVDLVEGEFKANSLHHLARQVAKATGLVVKTISREFAANPDRYPLGRLLKVSTELSNTRPGQGSSDLPVRANSGREVSKSCPIPVQPRSLPETPIGAPGTSAPAHAPVPPAASTLGSALPPPLPGRGPWYSKLAGPARWDTECLICGRFIPGTKDSGEGEVFGHSLHPYDSSLGLHSRFICLDRGCRALHAASVVVDNVPLSPDQGDPT